LKQHDIFLTCFNLYNDKVSNIRRKLCEILIKLRYQIFEKNEEDSFLIDKFNNALKSLIFDFDIDVFKVTNLIFF